MESAKLYFIAQRFFIDSEILNINMINHGLINKTYIVEHIYDGIKSKFILQSLSNIFDSRDIVNMNHKLVTDHIKKKINKYYFDFDINKWVVPNLIRCKSNNLYCFPFESEYWRAMEYIGEAFSLDYLEDEKMAYQTGIGLAKFHLLSSDLDSSKLGNSIKNFHDTRYYINKYNIILKDYDFTKLDNEVMIRIQELIKILSNHLPFVNSLLKSLSKESIDNNVIHGDPKLSNFLFDNQYKYVISLIDLDTVSSGNYLTDLADCLRSICNLSGEGSINKDNVNFDLDACKSFLNGYLLINNNVNSLSLLPEFIYLIIFELTIRYLTDFLELNRYFKIEYETHNLCRAEVQYRLLSSFLIQVPDFSNQLLEIGIPSCSRFVSDVQKFV